MWEPPASRSNPDVLGIGVIARVNLLIDPLCLAVTARIYVLC
jgi:hypothetical protein